MNEQDTSAYWRRLIELDKPLAADVLDKYHSWHRHLRSLLYAFLALPMRFYFREKVFGIENLPEKPPYIIAANHASSMDYVTVAWAIGKRREDLYPITTKLFYDNAWVRFWIKIAANAVRIDSIEDFIPALRAAVQVLRAGKAIYVNPEGMRSTNGTLLPFRPGVGVLAVETGVPLVPVYVSGTWKALPTGRIFLRPYPISVHIGKPIEMEPYIEKKKSRRAYDVYKEVTDELQSRVEELI
jgi:1-acyl-sn-glycerol-3-phosphate acyltransferase